MLDKGPQTHLNPIQRKNFLEHFAGALTTRYLHLSTDDGKYHPNDVEWWSSTACAELLGQHEDKIVQRVHEIVHEAVSAAVEYLPGDMKADS